MPGLTFIGDSNPTAVGASDTVEAHASTAVGDLVFAIYTYKRATNTLATPSGWTATTQHTVGTGTAGENDGPLVVGAFWRILTAAFSGPTLTPSGTTGNIIMVGCITWRPDTGWTVEVSSTAGSDTTSGTAFAATGAAVLPYVTDDWRVDSVACTNQVVSQASLDALSGTAPGGASGSTFNTYDGNWTSQSTTGDNMRISSVYAKVLTGPATTAPSLAVTLDVASTGGVAFFHVHPVHLPWHLCGIDGTAAGNHFKLQAALDGAGAVYEKTRAEIVAGYYHNDNIFPVGTTQEWCRFRVRIDGPTTGGTTYARSELREMDTDGTTQKTWSTATNTHRLKATIRVPSLTPFTKPTMVFGQIHDGTSDLVQVCTQLNATTSKVEGKLRINGTSSGRPTLDLDFRELEEHTYLIEMAGGVLRVYWDDLNNPVHITTDIAASTTAYFKVGCYPNTDETTDTGTLPAMVDAKNVRVWHTGYTGDQAAPGGAAPADQLLLAA